ncbi:MAG: hypothetical protein V2A61_06620 [Calditrichota bacterium]
MKRTLQVLNNLKREGIISDYAIGGGVAALFYAQPTLTYDLDVFILLAESQEGKLVSLGPIYNSLRSKGYKPHKEYVEIEGVSVQFLPASNQLQEEAVKEALVKRYEGTPIRVLRPEHLIAIAVQIGRAKDKARVSLLREQAKLDVHYLDAILERYNLKETFTKWTL